MSDKKIMEEWKDFSEPPQDDQPCEYVIELRCKGWFRPTDTEPRFAPDDREPPTARLVYWTPWKDGESWEQGFEGVRAFRKQIKKTEKSLENE